jgi:hypothetical protein
MPTTGALIVTKSTALATHLLFEVGKKWCYSSQTTPSRHMIHNHLVPHPLPVYTLVLTIAWIRNVLWPIVWSPLSMVTVRNKPGTPSQHKLVNSKLRGYPPLYVKVTSPGCCNNMRT